MQKRLPIGIEDFKEMIQDGYYYVDKTLLIKELLDKRAKVNLFTRPRRFGKTLNLNMLQYFFENTDDKQANQENRTLFQKKNIMLTGNSYTGQMQSYPVISLSFKSAKQTDWDLSFTMLRRQIAREFQRHQTILNTLSPIKKERYMTIMTEKDDLGTYLDSIAFLSECLYDCYQKKVIILIDEYDVPLENAYFSGFYPQMISFMRSLFESALKTNMYLEFAVITGCLRITKESIFTGLNNMEVISILNDNYGEYFGFTQKEVDELLTYYQLTQVSGILKEWYDGYLFGGMEVYNPWSIINYTKALLANPQAYPIPYWSNTSSSNIVKNLIEQADVRDRDDIEELMAGRTIEKPLKEDITYEDITASSNNLWNFLLFTGYLKLENRFMEGSLSYGIFSIPNQEIRYIYQRFILEWFDSRIQKADFSALSRALEEGDCPAIERELSCQLESSISYYDYREDFYHGFLVGILKSLDSYRVSSNRESGNGRPDILLKPRHPKHPAIVVELKYVKHFSQMERACELALEQIQKMNYANELIQEGYAVVAYGICFCQKVCTVKMGQSVNSNF